MTDEQQYQKGFNNAYVLAEHEPILLDSIIKELARTSEYLDGFLDGKGQFEHDRERVQLEEMNRLRNNSREEREVELDRED